MSVGSSGWSTIGRPSAPAYASAWPRIEAERTGAPSSENPTTPASASSPSAARVSPARPTVTAPWTSARTGDPEAAAAATGSAPTTDGSSIAGVVLGMRQTVVKPPCAGRREAGRHRLRVLVARLAEVRVQVDEPGRDHDPVGSEPVRVGARRASGSRRARRPAARPRPRPRGPPPGPRSSRGSTWSSTTSPTPRTLAARSRPRLRARPGQQVQQRHPHRDAVGHLVRDHRPRVHRRRRPRSRRPRSSAPGASRPRRATRRAAAPA